MLNRSGVYRLQKIVFSTSGEPYKTFNPFLFGSQSITFTNLEDGINRRLHYNKALNKDAVERYIPQFQEVIHHFIQF